MGSDGNDKVKGEVIIEENDVWLDRTVLLLNAFGCVVAGIKKPWGIENLVENQDTITF